ncbi:cytochrome c biogenesis protein CcdA [Candidatus Shapirobacteria bacterium]|nr:cytochrome c biogenesis protein CcdA [Candidatus Shapirobacteria bacterium]
MEQNFNLIAAFSAGLISFFAPCVLPLIPSYFSVITGFTFSDLYGLNFEKIRARVFLSSLFFVFGFVLFFTLLGAVSTSIGRLLQEKLTLLTRLGGLFLIFLGLVQLQVIKFEPLQFDFAWRVQKRLAKLGYLTAFVTGVISGLAWVPCIGPILASILLLASREVTILRGLTLLATFSLGIATPFLLLGLFFPAIFTWIQNQRKLLHYLSLIAGAVLIFFGLVLVLNQYQILINKFFALTGPYLEKYLPSPGY